MMAGVLLPKQANRAQTIIMTMEWKKSGPLPLPPPKILKKYIPVNHVVIPGPADPIRFRHVLILDYVTIVFNILINETDYSTGEYHEKLHGISRY